MDTISQARIASEQYHATEKQRLWATVYKCAYGRWAASGFTSGDDYATMVMALGLGDRFWG